MALLTRARQSAIGRLLPHTHRHSAHSPPKLPSYSRRAASSSSGGSSTESQLVGRLRVALLATSVGATVLAVGLYATDTRAELLHHYVVPPLLRLVFPDAEDAHHTSMAVLRGLWLLGLHPRERGRVLDSDVDVDLSISVFQPVENDRKAGEGADAGGLRLENPIGISAGLDKDADLPDALFALGAAVVEVGGCTPRPQPGNPRPRVFRVPGLKGLVNRYGLNSCGADAMASRLRARARFWADEHGVALDDLLAGRVRDTRTGLPVPVGALAPGKMLLVQVAKAKDTDEKDVEAVAADYAYCVRRLAPYADALVVNVSSPNTPGLRDLQAAGPLAEILTAVVAEAEHAATTSGTGRRQHRPRVLVKVSPDEDDDSQIEGVVRAVWEAGVDGVIVGNTTKRRGANLPLPEGVALTAAEKKALSETGGYSGPQTFDRTLALVKRYRAALDRHAYAAGPPPSPSASAQRQAGPAGSDSSATVKQELEAEIAAASMVPRLTGVDGGDDLVGAREDGRAPSQPQGEPQDVPQKIIFATGGISTGDQALAVLNAGASVAMVYTALVYGGAGAVTRMKEEMRNAIRTR